MGWGRRRSAAFVGVLGVLASVAPFAAPARAQPQPPPDPWVVDRPRFEPLDGSPITVEGIGDYRGAIELTRPRAAVAATNDLAVVNHVTLDDYLRGISEVPTTWPIEAQKAQAVAARTYALYETTKKANAPYKQAGADICATDACQVYAGLAKERRPGSEAWNAAVAQTNNQVLLYKQQPIVAKYSSSNGGEMVGGGQPYLRAAPDPDDAYSPLHRWRASYAIQDVVRVTGLAAEPVELHREDQEIVATYVDGEGNPTTERLLTVDFRSRLNNGLPTPAALPLPVPSIRFDVQVDQGIVHIDGRGWGHGIGLSQYGALGKAIRGMKAPDILAAYYGGLKPTTVPAERMPGHVKVALALDRREVAVTNATGRFRIVDGEGRVVANSASGTWRAVAPGAGSGAPKGAIRLVPPPEQAGPPTAGIESLRPEHPQPGRFLAVTVVLGGPAAVTRIDLVRPDGDTQNLDAGKVRLAGPMSVRLGVVQPGAYHLDLVQDAGNGRTTTTRLTIEVPAHDPAAGAPGGPDRPATDLAFAGADAADTALVPTRVLQATATFMLLAVILLGAVWVGRRTNAELH